MANSPIERPRPSKPVIFDKQSNQIFFDFKSEDDRAVMRIYKSSKNIEIFYREDPTGNWDKHWVGILS